MFLEWEWFNEPNMVKLFLYLLLKANHKSGEWRGEKVGCGQLITGLNSLSAETSISKQSLRTCLKRLEKTGEIQIESNTRYSVITICKYGTYQHEVKDTNTPPNTPPTHHQHTTNTPPTTNKNEKNNKNEIIEEIINYLNRVCHTNYKTTGKKTKDLIRVRMNEGFSIDDFKQVIDTKSTKWLNDKEMSLYLRPETLFSNKFEGYLNEPSTSKKPTGKLYTYKVCFTMFRNKPEKMYQQDLKQYGEELKLINVTDGN